MTGTELSVTFRLAMGLAVWILYAVDRLMDTRGFAGEGPFNIDDFEVRHCFHSRHRGVFFTAIVFAIGMLAILLPSLPRHDLHLYLIEGVFVSGYFVLVHGKVARPSGTFRWLPKELLVGPFFAAAAIIPTLSLHPELKWQMLPSTLLFAGLCCLNCLSIYAWEHRTTLKASWLTAQAISHLRRISIIFVLICFSMLMTFSFRPACLACGLSAIALMMLQRFGQRLSPVTLRAAADAALLSPLLIQPFLR